MFNNEPTYYCTNVQINDIYCVMFSLFLFDLLCVILMGMCDSHETEIIIHRIRTLETLVQEHKNNNDEDDDDEEDDDEEDNDDDDTMPELIINYSTSL